MILRRLDQASSADRIREPVERALSDLRRAKLMRTRPWKGFGEPLNGQAVRRRTVELLADRFAPRAMVETGTFLGFTTHYLAAFGLPTYTVEISRRYRYAAESAVSGLDNVTMFWGDSASALRTLAAEGKLERSLAYLDAHWEEEVPLAAEVDCLFGACEDLLVVVDDFHVPGQPGYAYDIYAGVPLSIEELPLPTGALVAYPAVPATEETGARRGTLYLGKGAAARAALEAAAAEGLVTVQPGP